MRGEHDVGKALARHMVETGEKPIVTSPHFTVGLPITVEMGGDQCIEVRGGSEAEYLEVIGIRA
jgi:hypothetical protein